MLTHAIYEEKVGFKGKPNAAKSIKNRQGVIEEGYFFNFHKYLIQFMIEYT